MSGPHTDISGCLHSVGLIDVGAEGVAAMASALALNPPTAGYDYPKAAVHVTACPKGQHVDINFGDKRVGLSYAYAVCLRDALQAVFAEIERRSL